MIRFRQEIRNSESRKSRGSKLFFCESLTLGNENISKNKEEKASKGVRVE